MPYPTFPDVSTLIVKANRKLALEILGIAAVIAILGVVCFGVFIQPTMRMHENAKWSLGKSKTETIARMGKPRWNFSNADWESRERENITQSYIPDPPRIECDEVLIYAELASMEILYIRNGVVIHVHSCGT